MPSPILARADALMQRRQHQAAPDDVPTLTEAIGDDGIPLLLNIETPAALFAEPAAPAPEPELANSPLPPPRFDGGERDSLIRELPQIIEATMRDFLAEQDIDENIPPRA